MWPCTPRQCSCANCNPGLHYTHPEPKLTPISPNVNRWAVLTSCFSHKDWGHIFFNGFTFFFMSPMVLKMLGSRSFIGLYLGGRPHIPHPPLHLFNLDQPAWSDAYPLFSTTATSTNATYPPTERPAPSTASSPSSHASHPPSSSLSTASSPSLLGSWSQHYLDTTHIRHTRTKYVIVLHLPLKWVGSVVLTMPIYRSIARRNRYRRPYRRYALWRRVFHLAPSQWEVGVHPVISRHHQSCLTVARGASTRHY